MDWFALKCVLCLHAATAKRFLAQRSARLAATALLCHAALRQYQSMRAQPTPLACATALEVVDSEYAQVPTVCLVMVLPFVAPSLINAPAVIVSFLLEEQHVSDVETAFFERITMVLVVCAFLARHLILRLRCFEYDLRWWWSVLLPCLHTSRLCCFQYDARRRWCVCLSCLCTATDTRLRCCFEFNARH